MSGEEVAQKVYVERRRPLRKTAEVATWIGLGVTIGLYVFFTIWWASGVNQAVERNSKWIELNQEMPTKISQIEAWVQQNQDLPASISKIETNFTHLSDKISRVTDQLDRLDTKMDRLIIDGAAQGGKRSD